VNNGGLVRKDQDQPLPFGGHFLTVVADAIGQGRMSVRRAATLFDITVDELHGLLDAYGSRLEEHRLGHADAGWLVHPVRPRDRHLARMTDGSRCKEAPGANRAPLLTATSAYQR